MQVKWCGALFALWTCALVGCGGGSSSETRGASYGGMDRGGYAASDGYASGVPVSASASEESYDGDYSAEAESAPAGRPMYAQAPTPAPMPPAMPMPGPGSGGSPPPPQDSPTANDATPDGAPLLIYEASLYLGVFKVEENVKAVATAAREAGGFLSRQTDNAIVVRVPAAKFTQVIEAVEALGDVLHREVQATDVSEEFRDTEIRLRNAMQVRDRLAELLARAQKVEESLQIEQQLERLTGEIERLKGRMRFLQDRIAYSTITVTFQPKQQEQINQNTFRLPFDWLDSLSLQWLLSL